MSEVLDDLFRNAEDAKIWVGTARYPGVFGPVAIVRVVLATAGTPRPWPKKMEFRRAVEPGTSTEMFVLFGDKDFLLPFAVVEWNESCDAFVQAQAALGLFVMEFVQPARLLRGLVDANGVAETVLDTTITNEEYETIQNAFTPEPLNSIDTGTA